MYIESESRAIAKSLNFGRNVGPWKILLKLFDSILKIKYNNLDMDLNIEIIGK